MSGLELLPFGFVVVSVGKQQGSVALFRKFLDNVFVDDSIAFLGSHLHDLTPLTNLAPEQLALLNNADFRAIMSKGGVPERLLALKDEEEKREILIS